MKKLQSLINAATTSSASTYSSISNGNSLTGNLYPGGISGSAGSGGYAPFTSSPSVHGISVDMRVVLVGGEGDSMGPEANPYWGVNGEYIAGTVQAVDPRDLNVIVIWDNGRRNRYHASRSRLAPLDDAPKPKGKMFSKKVELDATKLEPLVIDAEVKMEIVALLQQHKHAKKIFEDWGLAEVIEYGRGMTLMFWGGPGTGKTFGARCIAKALGKQLLVIGAAEIQSSEPGGANRAIQQAFETAAKENKVLFIDECDSLIANRANLGMILASEINTLLTEIEKTEGVVILATNRISDMDSALERRLSLIIEFHDPTQKQREAIWQGLLPKKMPLGDDVKIEELAEYELTGGLIKNVVLQSARLAVAEDGDKVLKKHFIKAIERTVSSQGLMGKERVQTDGMSRGGGGGKKDISRTIDAVFGKKHE